MNSRALPLPTPMRARPASPVLRRKCTCGGTPGPTGECEQCRKKRLGLQRSASSAGPGIAPPIVHDVLRSSGRPLDAAVRADLEPRFGHSFADVRVHTDARAAESAAAVGARAYTVGRDVVFAAGWYAPTSAEGRRLLAHELAHVVQQAGSGGGALHPRLEIGPVDDPLEREADAAAAAAASPVLAAPAAPVRVSRQQRGALRRKLKVDRYDRKPLGHAGREDAVPQTNEQIVREYVEALCPTFTVVKDDVVPTGGADELAVSCGCLSALYNLTEPGPGKGKRKEVTWKIVVDDSRWPETLETDHTVIVPSPYAGVDFGVWTGGEQPKRIYQPGWLTFAHELCGHAAPMAAGKHRTRGIKRHGGRPYHDPTVKEENKIAEEHGARPEDLRGTFKDPHHGESFGRIVVEDFSSGSSAVPGTAKQSLDVALKHIRNDDETKAEVVGHADRDENPALADDRAEAVRKALRRELGLEKLRVRRAWGKGAEACAIGDDPACCRRVEIFLYGSRGASEKH